MKKWYQWFYLSIGFAIGGIVNYFDGKQITAAVMQVGIATCLGFVQFFCDKKGEKGRKVFKYICIGATVLLVALMIYLLVVML